MTAEDRAVIRAAIDARARARARQEELVERELRGLTRDPSRCGGCGVDADERTRGCHTCAERHRRRWRRANDPAFNDRARREVAAYRQRRAGAAA